jgi:hypothetical protein
MICKKIQKKILAGTAKFPMKMSAVYIYFNFANVDNMDFGIFIDELQRSGIYIIDDDFESEFEKKLGRHYERKNTKANQKRSEAVTIGQAIH